VLFGHQLVNLAEDLAIVHACLLSRRPQADLPPYPSYPAGQPDRA
jgi:hypothetical protein